MPKVSIVLPVYNGEKYIKESIDSIIGQTFRDWELIVINDCSTDGTLDLLTNYAEIDDRIHIYSNTQNIKLPASLNAGFERAEGQYFTWTSDDNVFLPNALEKMVTFLDKNIEYAMVCASMVIIDKNRNIVSDEKKYDPSLFYYHNNVGACFMYRSQVWNEIGKYDINRYLVEDYDYWLRIIDRYKRIGLIDETLYLYRSHEESLTSQHRKKVNEQLRVLRSRHIEKIIKSLHGKLPLITEIYYDFLCSDENRYENECIRIQSEFPILKRLKKLGDENGIIAYGAGYFGDLAYELLGSRIDLYVDKDASLIKVKNGKNVILPEEINRFIEGRSVLLTVSHEKIYELLASLANEGIEKVLVTNLL